MRANALPNLKAEPTTASIEKINLLSKKQIQAIDFEALSTHIDRIHQIEQMYHGNAVINSNSNNDNTEISHLKAAPLKNRKPYIYRSRLAYLYPKHTFW